MRWIGFFPVVAMVVCGLGAARAATPDEAIEITDTAALKAQLGKRVLVKGTVREVEVQEKFENRKLHFEGAEVYGFVRKQTYGTGAMWKVLEDLPGKTIFMGGEVVEFKGELEILLRKADQIDEDAAKIDLTRIVLTESLRAAPGAESNKAPPAREGAVVPPFVPTKVIEFKSRSAEVRVLTRSLAQQIANPDAPYQIVKARARIEDAPGIGPAQLVTVPAQPRTYEGNIELMVGLPKKLGGWPRDCVIVVECDHKEHVSNVAVAVLIEAMLAGREIPPEVAVTGGLSIALDMLAGQHNYRPGGIDVAAGKILASEKKVLRLIGGPPRGQNFLENLRHGGKKAATGIHQFQLIGAKDLDELLGLIGIKGDGSLDPLLVRFDETLKVVRTRGEDILKHPKVQARITETLDAIPHHLTAAYYRKLGAGDSDTPRDQR